MLNVELLLQSTIPSKMTHIKHTSLDNEAENLLFYAHFRHPQIRKPIQAVETRQLDVLRDRLVPLRRSLSNLLLSSCDQLI